MGDNLDARISRLLDQLELPNQSEAEILRIKDKLRVLKAQKEQPS